MDAPQDFEALRADVTSALVGTVKTSGQISAEDLPFQRSLNPAFARSLDRQSTRLLGLARTLISSAVAGSAIAASPLTDVDDLESEWHGVVDVVDSLLEQTDTCLDEYTGVIKRPKSTQKEDANPVRRHDLLSSSASLIVQATVSRNGRTRPVNAFRSQNIPKPQLLFKSTAGDGQAMPFRPLLQTKPHAILPLEQSLRTAKNAEGLQV